MIESESPWPKCPFMGMLERERYRNIIGEHELEGRAYVIRRRSSTQRENPFFRGGGTSDSQIKILFTRTPLTVMKNKI